MFARDKNAFHFDRQIELFSLNASQLYVGYLSNGRGDTSRGLRLVGAGYSKARTIGEHIYVVTPEIAGALIRFLDTLLNQSLPASFQFPPEVKPRLFDDGAFEWVVLRFDAEWHGSGAFEGTLGGDTGHKITQSSAKRLRECVRKLFAAAA